MHTEHEHAHSHEHTHPHTHDGEHCHSHVRGADAPDPAAVSKDIALLKYMLEHNRAHASELKETGGKLKEDGKSGAAELIYDAVHCFDRGNEKLQKAVELLGEG